MDDYVFSYLRGLSLGYPLQVVDPLPLLNTLATTYLNDGSSFIVHEMITVIEAGHSHCSTKNGYDGFTALGRPVEAKTSNVRSSTGEFRTRGRFKGIEYPSSTHSGMGFFSSYTTELLEKSITDDVLMLVSGFIDGQLLYVVEFPYNHPAFITCIRADLLRKSRGGRATVCFDYRSYTDCESLQLRYVRDDLHKYEHCFTASWYERITQLRDKDGNTY